jgi:hypothetical protein
MIPYNDQKAAILYYIWKNSQKVGELSGCNLDEFDNFLPLEWQSGRARAAIHALAEEKSDPYLEETSRAFFITEAGIRKIEYDLANPPNIAFELQQREILRDGVSTTQLPIPASDRIVTLDHNSDPYRKAIVALDAAVTAFQEDHRLENEWGAEKSVLLQSLEAGQRLLKETSVRARTVMAIVIEPLKIIAARYREAIAAGLITATVDQVLPTLGRAVTAFLTLIGMS